MSKQDKRQYARQDKEISRLSLSQPERKKFEILYQNYTPYKHLGSWLQFIWRW